MNTQPIGLLWYKPPPQTLAVAAHQACQRFIERENGRKPVAILLNPCHQPEFLPPSPSGRGAGGEGLPILAGLPVQFDKMVRPNHLLCLAPDPGEPVVEKQKNSRRATNAPANIGATITEEANQ